MSQGLTQPELPANPTFAEGLRHYQAVFAQIERLAKLTPESNVDLVGFRADLDKLFTQLATVRNYWVGKGSVLFMEELSGSEEKLIELVSNCANQAANVPLMQVISAHFQITKDILKAAWDLPEDLFLNLYQQVLQGAVQPPALANVFWGYKSKPEFFDELLKGLMVTFQTIPAVDNSDASHLAACLSRVMRLLTDREKIPAAVEAFAANINVVSPLFKEFSRVCEYNQSANSADKVRNFEETLRMPAEFLALLYAETQDPWVKKIAGFCFKDPQGVLPYTFFELMGLKETREWHSQTLSLAEGNQMVKLIEHAIMVPGYDFPLNWPAIGRLDQANRAELIAVVARAGQAGKEYWGRAQKVLAVIIRQADYFDLEETAKRELFASSIPPEFFAAYPKLLSAKFSTDLGL